jgi:hypothetical protein
MKKRRKAEVKKNGRWKGKKIKGRKRERNKHRRKETETRKVNGEDGVYYSTSDNTRILKPLANANGKLHVDTEVETLQHKG